MAEKVGELYYDVTLETSSALAQSRRMQQENQRTGASFDALTPKLSTITRAISVLGAAMALVKAVRAADEVRLLGARIEVAAGSAEKGAAALAELQRISARTQTEVGANAGVFNRLNGSLLQMGGTQQDTLRITELLGKAIKVSGASGVEASSAMVQFGQALGSGKLAGDELRSLLENAPYLMRQLADGLGVPIGALKQLGEDGKLTADVVVNALSKAAERIDADFKKLPATFEGAMAAASDAAARANEALDALTGKSAALTGATLGLSEVLNDLAKEFSAATTEADKLGRKEEVKTWADGTRLALTYLADAADVVWQTLSVLGRNVGFVFQSVGAEIGGIGAQVAAVMRGDFAQAREIGRMMQADAAARRKALDDADARTLGRGSTIGARMREATDAAAAARRAEDRGFTPTVQGSNLRSTGGGDAKKAGKFDAEGYMAGLREGTLDGLERINAVETEAMRKAGELLKERKLTAEQYAAAITLIQKDAARERLAIQTKEAEDLTEAFRKADEANLAAEKKAAEERAKGQSFARGVIGAADPVAAILNETEEKSRILQEAAEHDLENAALYADAQVALEQETQRRLGELRQREIDQQNANNAQSLAVLGQFTGDVFSLLQQAGRDRTALAKAAFLASKAIAVAEIILNTEVAASKAVGQLGVFGLPLAATIRATGYASAGMVGGQALAQTFGGGRQYGGPATAGTMYRVNETGRPEMFTAANGSQYMLPTRSGNVTPADQVGGGAVVLEMRVINAASNLVTATPRRGADGQPELVIAEVAAQISERRGPVGAAMRNVYGRGSL